jgi:hypothetical protein
MWLLFFFHILFITFAAGSRNQLPSLFGVVAKSVEDNSEKEQFININHYDKERCCTDF